MSIADKLQTIAENESKVYEAGKQAEYDRFWDTCQDNGNRTNYDGAFMGIGWTEETFKPKYDIKPQIIGHTFRDCKLKCDLVELLEKQGVVLDFSNCSLFYYTFYNADVERIGVVGGTKVTGYQSAFTSCTAKVIDKIIINPNAKFINNTNFQMPNLEEIRFEGEIGQNGLSFQWSNNLSIESLRSIIDCLADKSADTSGTQWVVTVGSTNYAKLTEEDLQAIEQKGWNFK